MARALRILGLMLAILPAACAAPERPPARPVRPVPAPAPAPAPVITNVGLASVIGQTSARLLSLFGRPGLDVTEGFARKLQFANASCVLDAYLYPPAAGREAVVTHVDARLPDGRDFDPASCVTALMPPAQVP